ncbi:MAG: hypothetical protein ACWGO1_04925 [Anaerolineales bacterium]
MFAVAHLSLCLFETQTKEEWLQHWQATQISIRAEPAQPMHVDGEMVGETPVEIQVVPKAVKILVPGGETKSY